MGEIRDTDTWVRRVSSVGALFIFAGVIVIPYACDRAYRRWENDIDLFVALGERLEGARTSYQVKRASGAEWAVLIFEALGEVARGRSEARVA